MISVLDRLPEVGEKVICKVTFWRHGVIHHQEEVEAEFLGMNDIIGKPMFDIETYDEAYPEVTHWRKE